MTMERTTKECSIRIDLGLEPGPVRVDTGIGFLDHLLSSLAFHAGLSLQLDCKGDLYVDDHHSAEDSCILLGKALRAALGDGSGRARFGYAYAPLDEALARAVVDLSGRPYAALDLGLKRPMIGALAAENAEHGLFSLAMAAGLTLHVDLLRGDNDHHRAEAAYKAVALALRQALAPSAIYGAGAPSTKGSVDPDGGLSRPAGSS